VFIIFGSLAVITKFLKGFLEAIVKTFGIILEAIFDCTLNFILKCILVKGRICVNIVNIIFSGEVQNVREFLD